MSQAIDAAKTRTGGTFVGREVELGTGKGYEIVVVPPDGTEKQVMAKDKAAITTTDAGAPVAADEDSLFIRADGPIVLHDHYLIEHMGAFRSLLPD